MKNQEFRTFQRVDLIQPQRATFVLSPFALAPAVWSGASVILAEYDFGNANYWMSLALPIAEFGVNFVPAVRYVTDGNFVGRYKLWSDPLDALFYPVYNGEKLGYNAVLEIWSINTTGAPSLTDNVVFSSSLLVIPRENCSSCCINPIQQTLMTYHPPTIIQPGANCSPFCLPLVIN